MSLIFPNSPTIGQTTYTGGNIWTWDGERWYIVPSSGFTGSSGANGIAYAYVDDIADPAPANGELWFDTDNGYLSVYYGDEQTWVRIGNPGFVGSATGPGGPGYTGSAGLRGFQGYTGSIGTVTSGDRGYTGSKGDIGNAGAEGLRGFTGFTGSTGAPASLVENFYDFGSTSGILTPVITSYNVAKLAPSGSFSINLLGMNNIATTPLLKTTVFVVVIDQGATPYVPTSFSIDSALQTVKWQGGTAPTGNANKTDTISYTIFKYSNSNYEVLGQLVGFG